MIVRQRVLQGPLISIARTLGGLTTELFFDVYWQWMSGIAVYGSSIDIDICRIASSIDSNLDAI